MIFYFADSTTFFETTAEIEIFSFVFRRNARQEKKLLRFLDLYRWNYCFYALWSVHFNFINFSYLFYRYILNRHMLGKLTLFPPGYFSVMPEGTPGGRGLSMLFYKDFNTLFLYIQTKHKILPKNNDAPYQTRPKTATYIHQRPPKNWGGGAVVIWLAKSTLPPSKWG